MPKSILRFLALSVLAASSAFGQSTFGQIVFGGSWQTRFTFVNLSTQNTASGTLSFYADDGSPLNVPVDGGGNFSTFPFTIPPAGSLNIALFTSDSHTVQGWASMSTTGGPVRGQGSFRFSLPTGTISEAVIPLSQPNATLCIIPFPESDPVILLPFDNTTGQYATSLAFVNTNTTSTSQNFTLEFYDQSNHLLVADTLNLKAMAHKSFVTKDNYSALLGQKGILRIHASTSNLTVLGLLSNSTGAISTIVPITQ